jgi:nicotinamidase-related amidase
LQLVEIKKEEAEMTENWGKTAFIIIDVQVGLFTGEKPIYQAETLLENINTLAEKARAAKIPVIYIQHANKGALAIGTEGHEIHQKITPQKDEKIYLKTVTSAFEETSLHEDLQNKGIETLVLTGLLTNACVNGNSRAAKELGYRVILVEDGHSTRGEAEKVKRTIERYNKQLVKEEIVELIATKEVKFETT